MRITDYLARGQTWAITRESLETILAIANREGDVEALLKQRGDQPENTFKVEVRDGIAMMAIDGPIFPKANLFSMISGATSVDLLAANLGELERDPSVTAVVLNIDSPGGSVKGINEFAGMVRDFGKPIVAYVGGTAASAAYWIASAADEIIVEQTAAIGSIGIVATYRLSDDNDIEIVSSHAPDKRPDISTDEGRALVLQNINDVEAVFIETIMQNRNLTHEQVTQLRGGIVIGAKAISAGLADRLGSLEGILQELTIRGKSMDIVKLKADHKELYQAVFNEGAASVNAEQLAADGASAERARIAGILNHEAAAGRETQAKVLALDTDMSDEQAAKVLAVSPKVDTKASAGGDQFSQHMAKLGNPDVTADREENEDPQASAASGWARSAAKVTALRGGKR